MGSHRRSIHKPLLRNLQRRSSRRRPRAPRPEGASRLAQSVARYPSLPRRAVRPQSPTNPPNTNKQTTKLTTPAAPTANTSSGPTATTATCAPKTTPSTAPSPPVPSLLSAPSPVLLTPLVPAARRFMPQLVLRPITLMLRVMRRILTRTS